MRFLQVILNLIFLVTLLYSCDRFTKQKTSTEEKVAQTYCSSCHLYTPPHLLDKASWLKVLPVMKEKIELTGIILPKEDWNTIYHYYYNNAPFNLSLPLLDTLEMVKINMSLIDSISTQSIAPQVTSISENENNNLVIGTLNGNIHSISLDKTYTSTIPTELIPINLKTKSDSSILVLNMGELGPHHEAKGSLIRLSNSSNDTLVDELHRPIHFTSSDLNENDRIEYIISEFGSTNEDKETGGLWLYEKDSDSSIQISSYTGASKSIVTDLDKDGKDDIIALFAQGDEKIIFYKNEGDLKFSEKILLRFNPLFGCLDFIIDDVNKDGKNDILLVNGDNADYSPIFKPYHGFRVFQQNDHLKFDEKIFHHINGASKILEFSSAKRKMYGIFSLYPDLYSRPWENISFMSINPEFESKRYYTTELTGNNWVISNIDQDGNLLFGKNLSIQKNIPSLRSYDPLKNLSVVKFEINFTN